MNTKHTPLPWHADAAGNIKQTATAERVAVCDHAGSLETHTANTAFIVTTCNHHDELVRALEVFQQLSNNLSVSLTPDQIAAATAAIASHATQVHFLIAKARGTP